MVHHGQLYRILRKALRACREFAFSIICFPRLRRTELFRRSIALSSLLYETSVVIPPTNKLRLGLLLRAYCRSRGPCVAQIYGTPITPLRDHGFFSILARRDYTKRHEGYMKNTRRREADDSTSSRRHRRIFPRLAAVI